MEIGSINMPLIVVGVLLFALPLMFFFARLSWHYSKFFAEKSETAITYKTQFTRKEAIVYQPVRQIKFLLERQALNSGNPVNTALIKSIILDLRLTMFWIAGAALISSLVLAYQFVRQIF